MSFNLSLPTMLSAISIALAEPHVPARLVAVSFPCYYSRVL